MDRKYWIILALGIVVILYLRSRVAVESSPQAINTMLVKANTPAGGTGYYAAGDLGYKSPFADSSPYAGATLVVDITPHSASNNLAYDPNQSAIVV